MSEQVATLSDLFPDQIVSEILTRVPTKSICRFKSVSKRWNSLISHSHFITSYISRSLPSWLILNRLIQLGTESIHPPTRFLLSDYPAVSTFSINPHSLAAEPVLDPARSKYPAVVLQSSGGLLLFTLEVNRDPHKAHAEDPSSFSWVYEEESLFVTNPVTNQWAPLGKPPGSINKRTHVAFTTRVDPTTGGVVKFMAVEYTPIIGCQFAKLMCFSSDTGKWVSKQTNYMLGAHMWRAEGSFEFEGRLFWVDVSTGLITWEDDPFEGIHKAGAAVCKFIPLPRGRAKPFNTPGLENERHFDTGGGVIQYVEVFKQGLKVWRLKNYKEAECEWSLVYKVPSANIDVVGFLGSGSKKAMPRPCFVHPFDAGVGFFENGDEMFSLDMRTRKVEMCGGFDGLKYVLPFVVPRWPASLPPRFYAAFAKEEGNEFFKGQNFDEAIKCYSRCINLSPSATVFANRAMAYLKVSNFGKAEDDCSEALKLDGEFFKVYVRRAMARKELGKLQGAMKDVEFALKLKPDNNEVKNLHAEIKSLLEKASLEEHNHGHEDDDVTQN